MQRYLLALVSLVITATFFAFSLVIFLTLLAVAVPLVAWWWWRIRARMQAQELAAEPGVIEADYVVIETPSGSAEQERQR